MNITILKYVVIALVSLGILYLGYDKVYSVGYNKASAEYEVKMREYDDKLRSRINNIELNSAVLLEEYSKSKLQASKDFKAILAAAKSKPLVVYQNGNCEISPDFSKAYIEALKKANKK